MLLLLLAGLIISCVHEPAPARAATLPRIFAINPAALAGTRDRLATNAAELKPAYDALIADATRELKRKAVSVMDKPKAPASGDKHDYSSIAPYFWPDPAKPDGLPYVRKDGQRNPESGNEHSDAPRMGRTAGAAHTLALAYYLSGREEFASHAAHLLRVWFLDSSTRMNPNFNHAQAIPGVNTGRGIGMIESRSLTSVCDAVGLLARSTNWTAADQHGMEDWMQRFLEWAQTSKNGRDEAAAKNNHGSFYDEQTAHFALFLGQTNLARQIIEGARERRIATQFQPDGRQPLELAREDSFGYSRFNLQALFALATLGERVGVDLWRFESKEGASLRRGLDYLLPYSEDPEKPWPHEKSKKQDRSLAPLLRQAHFIYGSERYWNLLTKTPGYESRREALWLHR